ncbi:MAG TPA: tetratricopeptide repeat protein [Gemmatimonadaceae bacterium]|nr:tetratricopeptide repeat protein [Gemmatimonadaceae bacterium]
MATKPSTTTTGDTTPARSAVASDRGRDLMDWFQVNSRYVVIAAVVIAVAAAGYWFYMRSQQIKTINAERSLVQAEQSLQSGNTALATSDLQRVVTRYKGTAAGTEAAMLLAQTHYNAGKYQDGIKVLEEVSGKAGGSEASLQSLIGDGYSQLGKAADAAKAYERAADAAEFDTERAYYRAKAARSFTAAGNVNDAKRIWSQLATDEKAQAVAAEARVRLAELTAKPAKS